MLGRVLLVAALVGVLLSGCGGTKHGSPTPPSEPGAGTRRALEPFTDAERHQAEVWSLEYVSALVRDHPELSGLTVSGVFPVFDEDAPRPVGAMARLVLPAAVPVVTMSLVRSRNGTPEPIESVITNLRGLDAILMFASEQVVELGIAPQAGDAKDPSTATKVRPIDPEQHRDPEFGDTD